MKLHLLASPSHAFIYQIHEAQMCSISNKGCVDFNISRLAIHTDTDKNNRSNFYGQPSVSKGFIKIHPSFIQRSKNDTSISKRTFAKKLAKRNLEMKVAFYQHNHANLFHKPRQSSQYSPLSVAIFETLLFYCTFG